MGRHSPLGVRHAPPARRKGSSSWRKALPSPARVKRDFTRFAASKIEMKSQRATAESFPARRRLKKRFNHFGGEPK